MISPSMTRHSSLAVFLIAAFAVVGCNKSNTLPELGPESGANRGGNTGASTIGSEDGSGIEVSPIGSEQQRLMDQRIIYFDYDQADIRPEFNTALTAHGQFLAGNPGTQIRLEGHADERGSREYNIGLGERRAQAVRRALMLQGASPEQLSTVSYGEERPAAVGGDEEAMSLNRRVELVYRQ
ncbi:MAG TPA: peptidoglycan-associated lipoprotein Pal [Gammaproteobacteria bacterium]|nr:peptidoglycan-associated lipoprotein Pal [Gammaproteobacteria bacterium]